jgi:hypothetical protein
VTLAARLMTRAAASIATRRIPDEDPDEQRSFCLFDDPGQSRPGWRCQ